MEIVITANGLAKKRGLRNERFKLTDTGQSHVYLALVVKS